jgi:hypothetical protein
MKYENKIENDMNDSTKKIVTDSEKKNLNDITSKWTRDCPKCNKEIIYKDKYKLKTALDKNTLCIGCARFNKKFAKNTNYNKPCPKCSVIIFYPNRYSLEKSIVNKSLCRSCCRIGNLHPRFGVKQSQMEKETRRLKLTGLKRSDESIKRYSLSKMGEKNPMYGNKNLKSDDHKRKIRLSCVQKIKEKLSLTNKKMSPGFNPNACKIIDEYGKQNGYSFQHALNGGEFYVRELGYFVDGYDNDKNTVIEYYEYNHWHLKNKSRDELRKKEIIDFMKCDFIILRQTKKGGNYLPEHFRFKER